MSLLARINAARGSEPRGSAADRPPDPGPAPESHPAAGRFERSLREVEAELAACLRLRRPRS